MSPYVTQIPREEVIYLKNILLDKSDHLCEIDYKEIFETAGKYLANIEIDETERNINISNLDIVVNQIVEEILKKNNSLLIMLGINRSKQPSDITINHKNSDDFTKDVIEVYKGIKNLMQTANLELVDLENYKSDMAKKSVNFGLDYDFKDKIMSKQKLSFENKNNLKERLRIDEATISLSIKDIEVMFKANLVNYLKNQDLDEDLLEERIADIQGGKKRVDEIIKTLNDESMARIKRTISYLYLEYLLENAPNRNEKTEFLKDYVRRFKILDKYLKYLASRPEQESLINIDERIYNICDLLSTGNAFESLPLIGLVEGIILEDRNDEKKEFKVALKMKLNGEVKKEKNTSSYNYRIKYIGGELLEEQSKNIKTRLISFFLYNFMFNSLGNTNHNPCLSWEKTKKYLIKNGFDKTTKDFVKAMKDKNLEVKIKSMQELLENIVKYKSKGLKKDMKKFTRTLILYNGIMADDIEGPDLFKKVKYSSKEYLQYISIVEEENDLKNILLSMPINITIKTSQLYESGEREDTNLAYDISKIKCMPIVMYPLPIDNEKRTKYKEKFKSFFKELYGKPYIGVPYLDNENIFNENNERTYLHKITYITLLYLIINRLLENRSINDGKNLFIPIIRFHHDKQEKAANFARNLSKTLEHILSIDYRSSSQGFNVTKSNDKFFRNIYLNGASSLYSKIPKLFKDNLNSDIKKVAMIVVTSRKSDGVWSGGSTKNTLIGETILFDIQVNDIIRCDLWGTFAENYNIEDIYTRPVVLNDIVKNLYDKGYKDILYIARAPYSSKLNITNQEVEMYFMSESVLDIMKTKKQDLMIYPLYYEHFYAIDYNNKNSTEALYIKDTKELDQNLVNLNKAIAGVFNLYSGKCVGKTNEGKNYRSVILYSTLCNMYKDHTLNAQIYKTLIGNSKYKDFFTGLLTLFHYSMYEANNNINIKINPYEKLMGDNGVSANSIYEFFVERTKFRFNSLAFLIEIKKIVDKEKAYGIK